MSWSNGEEREKQHFAYALNSPGQAARLREVDDGDGTWHTTATPLHQRQIVSGGGFIVSRKIAMTE